MNPPEPAIASRTSRFSAVQVIALVATALVFAGIGYFVRWAATPPGGQAAAPAGEAGQETVWTCSMHPEVRRNEPGQCPKCGMDLIPASKESDEDDLGPRQIAFSRASAALMDIETAPAERRFVTATVRMVGKVAYDETRLAYLTAWVPGRLDRLYVDYTGVSVRKGDHMVYMYSPELLSAQEELLAAKRAVAELAASNVGIVRQTAEATVEAAREKLRLLGLLPEQIAELEARGQASDHLTIYAPVGGIVVHKNAQQGMYVQTGTRIYTIADLSVVWVMLDAYESDLAWLHYGQKVRFTSVAYPGETFAGTIAFIDPVLNEQTRTVKVRVNVPNAAGKLKPDMFVKAEVAAEVAAGGRVMAPDLAGKWICPMHPDVVANQTGACDICEMPLVMAESLGYVAADEVAAMPLVIPASAPLVTGTRAVVYVAFPGRDRPTFEGREIELGPRAGDYYLVRGGLAEGERVVVRGNFKIDSAMQILAKPSMMSPEGGAAPAGHAHGRMPHAAGPPLPATAPAEVPQAFREQLAALCEAYLAAQQALAADGFAPAAQAVGQAREALAAIDMAPLPPEAHARWMPMQADLVRLLDRAGEAEDIKALRLAFGPLSQQVIAVVGRLGNPLTETLYQMHCPMAFNDQGADWLQKGQTVQNPYFGSAMLLCGVETAAFAPAAKQQ